MLNAVDTRNQTSSTLLKVFIEAPETTTTIQPTTTNNGEISCYFKPKVYETTILENTNGKSKLTQVHAECVNLPPDSQILYYIHQGANEFEINENTGELYVNGPLDRENRTLHFVVINLSVITPDGTKEEVRRIRQSNPIVECKPCFLKR